MGFCKTNVLNTLPYPLIIIVIKNDLGKTQLLLFLKKTEQFKEDSEKYFKILTTI